MINYRPPYKNELWHYGILGQKWGVRRFQNPDGTLTDVGKKRYDKAVSIMNEEARKFKNRNYIIQDLQNRTSSDLARIDNAKTAKERRSAQQIKNSNDELFKYTFEMQLNTLRRYKNAEEIASQLGEIPFTYLEQYPNMKTFYKGSPYNK